VEHPPEPKVGARDPDPTDNSVCRYMQFGMENTARESPTERIRMMISSRKSQHIKED
jgi:hypothetical protein